MKKLWMGALLWALVGCPGCPPPGPGDDGGEDGGPDGGDAGCLNGFCTFTLDPAPMKVLAEYTPQVSAALGPNDRIGIAYFKEDAGFNADGGPDNSYTLQYLEWQGGSVTVGPEKVQVVHNISGVSVAFQGNGQPAVGYLGGTLDQAVSTSWWQHDAVVSYRSGTGTWTEQIAVSNSGEAVAGNPTSDNGVIVGLYTGLAFDGNHAYLVYRDVHYGQSVFGDYDGSDFELAEGGPTGWSHQVLIAGGNQKSFWGCHPQLIMANNRPAVVTDRVPNSPATNGQDVYFQRRADGGTAWTSPPILVSTAGDTTSGPALAWDVGERFGVAFSDRKASGGQALYFYESGNGLTFVRDIIAQSGSSGWYPTTAFNPATHEPVVAYYLCSVRGGVTAVSSCPASEDELQLAERVNGFWQTPKTVDPAGAMQPRLFFLSTGKRALVYRDPRNGNIRLALEQ